MHARHRTDVIQVNFPNNPLPISRGRVRVGVDKTIERRVFSFVDGQCDLIAFFIKAEFIDGILNDEYPPSISL